MNFKLLPQNKNSTIRLGEVSFTSGTRLQTPAFVPIIHCNVFDTLMLHELHQMGFNLVAVQLLNLLQRPGWTQLLAMQHGLRSFLSWPEAILTEVTIEEDLSSFKVIKQVDNKVLIQSLLDGQRLTLDAGEAIRIQQLFAADIITPTILPNSEKILPLANNQGFLLGGDLLSQKDMHLPREELRYWRAPTELSLATVKDNIVTGKVDLVSSSHPGVAAHRGELLIHNEILMLSHAQYAFDFSPPTQSCACYTCQRFTRAYLHHLITIGEMLGIRLIALHNFFFYRQLFLELASV